jgi:hypothetical protein
MPKSGSELLFLGLIIAGFMLFNYVARQLARKAREQQEAAAAQPAAAGSAPPPGEEPLEEFWGRVPAPRQAAPEPVAPPAPSRRRSGARLFRTRRDLRQAVVAMTVLGPCRALEPHEHR